MEITTEKHKCKKNKIDTASDAISASIAYIPSVFSPTYLPYVSEAVYLDILEIKNG